MNFINFLNFLSFFKKKYFWAALYSILLAAFTLYVVMDTFVITRVYAVVQPKSVDTAVIPGNSDAPPTTEPQTEPATKVITENSYSDENISVTITEYREYDTDIYAADIKLSSVDYLKTAFADNSYGKNVTAATSETAEENNAVLAINGDFYGVQTRGYVIRNGELYRSTVGKNGEDIVIWKDGSFGIIKEREIPASSLIEKGALHVLSFGPALLNGGAVAVTRGEEVERAQASNPRTAVGIIGDLHYLFIVSDGRTRKSAGLSLYELAEFMKKMGASVAYNLDGGGSATMYFNGRVINNPTENGKVFAERKVSDIVYIGY